MLPTDNPYATSKPFDPQDIDSYLVPDRVIGRIPDMKGSQTRTDPAWLVDYLKTATCWEPKARDFYKKTYAICTSESTGAGKECMQFISKPRLRLAHFASDSRYFNLRPQPTFGTTAPDQVSWQSTGRDVLGP